MKKTVLISLTVIAILLLGTSLAMAYESPEEYVPAVTTQELQGPNFIDEDNDGVCDLAGIGAGGNFIDENGDGVCDLAGRGIASTGQGFGRNGMQNGASGENFIDEDGDGVCDLAGTGQSFGRNGMQSGACGDEFVDEDGDGICDLAGRGIASTGQGQGHTGLA